VKVRDVLKLIEAEGWRLKEQEGSHRQFAHATREGKVTIAGHPSVDVPKGTLRSILRQAGIKP
jgi:predicted RNA binding protein YcfA (HicA-like mRNA interferase family)